MDEILHQLISSWSHYLQGFIHSPVVSRISSINSSKKVGIHGAHWKNRPKNMQGFVLLTLATPPSQASFHSSVKVSHQHWPTSRASLTPCDKALLLRQRSKNSLFSLNLIKSWFQMIPWFNIPIILRPKTCPGLSKYLDHFSAPMMCWRIWASDVAYAVLPPIRSFTVRPWLRR